MFASVEYMFWWSDGRTLPPLVTGAANSAALAVPPAALGNGILFGGTTVGGSDLTGGRLTLGMWADDSENTGYVARIYTYEGENNGFSGNQNTFTDAVLGHPFFNTSQLAGGPNPNAFVFHNPNGLPPTPATVASSTNIQAQNDVFAADVTMRSLIDGDRDYRLDLLLGTQYTRIDDDLTLATSFESPVGVTRTFNDLFDCENDYLAGTLGLQSEFTSGAFKLSTMSRIGLGNMRQRVLIRGNRTLNGAPDVGGGVYAQSTNSGSFARNVFCVAPEAGVNLGVAMTEDIDFTVGYTFILWSRVAMAGDNIDSNVNGSLLATGVLPGGEPADPAFRFQDDSFWVQALSLGMNFRY